MFLHNTCACLLHHHYHLSLCLVSWDTLFPFSMHLQDTVSHRQNSITWIRCAAEDQPRQGVKRKRTEPTTGVCVGKYAWQRIDGSSGKHNNHKHISTAPLSPTASRSPHARSPARSASDSFESGIPTSTSRSPKCAVGLPATVYHLNTRSLLPLSAPLACHLLECRVG